MLTRALARTYSYTRIAYELDQRPLHLVQTPLLAFGILLLYSFMRRQCLVKTLLEPP